MEAGLPEIVQTQNTFNNLCCENHISSNSVSVYNNTPSFELIMPGQKIIHSYGVPAGLSIHQQYIIKVSDSNSRPPGTWCPDDPSCPLLCIFRI